MERKTAPKKNVYKENNKILVSRVECSFDESFGVLKNKIKNAVDLIGGFEKVVQPGDKVFIKLNLNSDDPYPASSDPDFLKAVIELLQECGAKDIIVGDMAGVHWLPTTKAMNLGVKDVCKKLGVKALSLENQNWVKVKLNAPHYKTATISEELYKKRKLIYLPCFKTHHKARFTMSLKLSMGLCALKDRLLYFHGDKERYLEENIAYLNTLMWPDLIILDGRKCFVTEGPSTGIEKKSNLIMASGDRTAIDVEGVKKLLEFPAENEILKNPWQNPQIKWAVKLDLGTNNNNEILIKTRKHPKPEQARFRASS